MEFLTGLIGAALSVGLFGGGFFAGWKVREAIFNTREPSAESPAEEEKRRAEEEEAAYQKMMNYSVETAYGLNKKEGIDA